MAAHHEAGKPLPIEVERMADKWLHKKIQASKSNTAMIRTGGRPAKIQKITDSRKPSTEVTKAYQKQRTKQIDEFRQTISLKQGQIHILHDTKTLEPRLDVDSTLALQRQMHSTWEGMDVLRRYMESIDVHLASERQMRRRRDELLNDPIEGRMIPLVFPCDSADGSDGYITKPTPFVYLKNLPELVVEFLERHLKLGNLTTHGGMIPDNEIWIKLGGDKGGSSMKMFLQVVNIPKPNSAENTIVFAAFNGGDSMTNMDITMEQFLPQIDQLKNMIWRGYKFKLSFFGDCELICRVYGILSCNAVCACPYCEESKTGWQTPLQDREPAPLRTLESINQNYLQYQADGCRKERSKIVSKSVVRPPMFPIEPQDINVPSLHIGLGVFKKMYDMLEVDANNIDSKIYKHRVGDIDDDDDDDDDDVIATKQHSNFDQAIMRRISEKDRVKETIEKKKEQVEDMFDDIPLASIKKKRQKKDVANMLGAIGTVRQEINELEEQLENNEFRFRSGPIVAALDRTLDKHGISRQAYHGKAFNGNHVKKGCKNDVFMDLVETPSEMLQQLGTDNMPLAVTKDAQNIKTRYSELFSKYAEVHNRINHGRHMTEEEIDEAEVAVREFMESYRRILPNCQISLKLHFLEDHAIPQMRRLKAGLGKMNEQGGENVHSKQNKSEQSSANLKKQPLRHLMTVMTNSLTAALPDIQSKMRYRKKRKINVEE
ncbi:uncharacterized protein [Amphiura filiformis]|uniref:uncharacterized protein n=1 Tax=Amphiura filiformis TaxID=82378 RepID=UPI003B223697